MKESRTLPGPRFWTGSLQKGEGDNLLEMKPPTLWCFMMAALDADTPPEPTHPSSELYGDLCFCSSSTQWQTKSWAKSQGAKQSKGGKAQGTAGQGKGGSLGPRLVPCPSRARAWTTEKETQ